MNILSNDILKMSYKGEETLWLSERLVKDVCGLSDSHLRKNRSEYKKTLKRYHYRGFLPKSGKSWRFGRVNNVFYYDYDSLPNRRDTQYRNLFGSREDLLRAYEQRIEETQREKEARIAEGIVGDVSNLVDNEDMHYYVYDSGFGFNRDKATELSRSRAWCRYIVRHIECERYKELGFETVKSFYDKCSALISVEKLEGLKVKTGESLRNKINKYKKLTDKESERDFFISKKYGNNNAQKVGKHPIVNEETGECYDLDIHKVLMGQLYMNPGGSTKESVKSLHKRYERDLLELFPQYGEKPVAYRTFLHHVRRWNAQILMSRARHGEDYYRKHILTYTASEELRYSHSLFAGDGSGVISYKYLSGGKLKHRKLYVTMITDVASRYIAGYGFAPEGSSAEDVKATEVAVKMAVERSGRETLFEFVSDNHRSFTSNQSKKLLKAAFRKVRTIGVGNSQSNPAEVQFRLFKTSLKDIKNFVSSSWGARSIENEANPDYLDIEEMPTYSEAIVQFEELVNRWNASPLRDGVSPVERFRNKNPECKALEASRIRYLFGNHTSVNLGYMRGYVKVYKTRGYEHVEDYLFEIPDFGGEGTEMISKMTGHAQNPKVRVVWDEKGADIYTMDGEFILSCKPALKSSMAEIETSEEHRYARRHHLMRKKNQMHKIEQYENKIEEVASGLGYSQSMALGGNKESFNREMELQRGITSTKEMKKDKAKKRERVERDFKNRFSIN